MPLKKTGSRFKKREIKELKQVFDEHDKDGSGEVSVQEMMQHLKKTSGASFSTDFTKALDKNGDGKITFKEYLVAYYRTATAKEIEMMLDWVKPEAVAEPVKEALTAEQVEEFTAIFNLYDKNRDGKLDLEEVKDAIKGCGFETDEAEDMIEEHDADKNGTFNFDEFTAMISE